MRAISNDKPRSVYAFIFKLTSGLLTQRMLLPAIAQVKSHGTTNTIVNQNDNNLTIINVIEKGNNLFHSFSSLSVPTDDSATFYLTKKSNITTIFSQVKGGNISDINGLIIAFLDLVRYIGKGTALPCPYTARNFVLHLNGKRYKIVNNSNPLSLFLMNLAGIL